MRLPVSRNSSKCLNIEELPEWGDPPVIGYSRCLVARLGWIFLFPSEKMTMKHLAGSQMECFSRPSFGARLERRSLDLRSFLKRPLMKTQDRESIRPSLRIGPLHPRRIGGILRKSSCFLTCSVSVKTIEKESDHLIRQLFEADPALWIVPLINPGDHRVKGERAQGGVGRFLYAFDFREVAQSISKKVEDFPLLGFSLSECI